MEFLEDDTTLSLDIKESFEAEAIFFASTTLFQQDRFISELNKLPFEIKTSIHLAKYSVHPFML